MRSVLPILALASFLVLAGPSSLAPFWGLQGGAIDLRAISVVLDPDNPARRQVGELTFLRGWRLTSSSNEFGGLSALKPWRGRWVSAIDVGALVFFAAGDPHAEIVPVPPRCGPHRVRLGRDIEGLDTDGTRIWVSAEWHNSICRFNAEDGAQVGIKPPAMADWPRRSGPETLLRLRDGRFLVLPEDASIPALVFPRDPVSGVRPARIAYRPPAGFSPTDAAELPDGRIVILNRTLGLRGFTAKLVLFDGIPSRGVAQGREIATLAAPLIHDNFEGISARREGGATILTIVSDDNYSRWQQTLLLKFRLNG